MTRVYFLEVAPDWNDNVSARMIASLSSARRDKVQRYRHEADRKTGLFAEALVRCAVCNLSGEAFGGVDIQTSPSGKPFLANPKGYHFNISHTKYAVAAAIADRPVGVDTERIRDFNIALAEKIFSENELALLRKTTENQNRQFFDIWTKKEALLKYHGTGLTNNMKAIDVTGVFASEKFSTIESGEYLISTCSEDETQAIDFIRLSEEELVGMWRQLSIDVDGED